MELRKVARKKQLLREVLCSASLEDLVYLDRAKTNLDSDWVVKTRLLMKFYKNTVCTSRIDC